MERGDKSTKTRLASSSFLASGRSHSQVGSRRLRILAWSVLAGALAVGVAVRLRMVLMHRSLWLDPAMLALNVAQKSYADLFGPLARDQVAPVGFLLASKLVGSLTGYSDIALTVVPLCFSLGALVLFLPLSIDVLGPTRAPLAFIPFATCSTAVYYAGEFKQYSGDLFFTVLVLHVAHRVLLTDFSRRAVVRLTLVGLIAVWFSHSAVLVIAGAAGALGLSAALQRDRGAFRLLVPAALVLAINYGALYVLQLLPAAPEAMFLGHAGGYAPIAFHSPAALTWWWRTMVGYASFPLGFGDWVILPLACLAVGSVVVLTSSKRRQVGFLLLLPALALLLASAVGRYPIHTGQHDVNSRLVLFTVPIALLLIGIGLSWIADVSRRPFPVGLILGAALVWPSVERIARWPAFIRQEMRPLVADLAREREPGDTVYVYFAAVPSFEFYTLASPIPHRSGRRPAHPTPDLPRELAAMGTPPRLWIVVAHDFRNDRSIVQRSLETRYATVTTHQYPGAWLILAKDPQRTESTADEELVPRSPIDPGEAEDGP